MAGMTRTLCAAIAVAVFMAFADPALAAIPCGGGICNGVNAYCSPGQKCCEDVQCIRAPCPPICTTPAPLPVKCGRGFCQGDSTCNADNKCCSSTNIVCVKAPCPSEFCTEPIQLCGAGYCEGSFSCKKSSTGVSKCCRDTGIRCATTPCPSEECFPPTTVCGNGYCNGGKTCKAGFCCKAAICTKPSVTCGEFGGECVNGAVCQAGDPIGTCCKAGVCKSARKPCGYGFCNESDACSNGLCCPIFTNLEQPPCTSPVR